MAWRLPAPPQDVYDLLFDFGRLPAWWPAMFLDALQVQPGDERGVGRVYQLRTRGWLPLRLRWYVNVTSTERPYSFQSETWGDLTGAWDWQVVGRGATSEARCDWTYRLEKVAPRLVWPLLRPLFALSQDWSLRRGEQSLVMELARRASVRGEAPPTAAAVPPGPARLSAQTATVALVGLAALYVLLRARRGRSR